MRLRLSSWHFVVGLLKLCDFHSLSLRPSSHFLFCHCLTEQHQQHDEHVQWYRWLWQRQSKRWDSAEHELQLQDRRSQHSGKGVSQPRNWRWEEATHWRVSAHTHACSHLTLCKCLLVNGNKSFIFMQKSSTLGSKIGRICAIKYVNMIFFSRRNMACLDIRVF